MDTWFSLPLGDGITAGAPSDEIQAAFNAHFAVAGKPADMAIFIRFDSEGHLQCEVTAYFSPAASALATRLGARPCAKPLQGGLGLLAGDERAWAVLFSESRS